ncbi:isopeptide-forming domain-containing fimbrial protein, partial [Allochromatium palmeri]
NTAYVADSTTLNGSRLADSGGGLSFSEGVMTLQIGTLAAAGEASATATITFRVALNSDVPAGTVISNQGVVDSDQTVPEPTDADDNEANGDQPTTIPVGGAPSLDDALYVEKVVTWSQDSEPDGAVTPGDTLTYTLVLSNRGDEALTTVSVTDSLPSGLTYVVGSAQIQSGTVIIDDRRLNITLPELAAGDFEFVSFAVTIDDPLVDNTGTADVETFTNQAIADSDQTNPVGSDSNGDPSDGRQPTTITAVSDAQTGTPALDVEKRWSLAVDVDGDGRVDPGDALAYRMSVRNTGSAQATNVRLNDTIPSNTRLVADSVTSSQGAVISAGDPIQVNLGTLEAGAVATVGFQVTVNAGTGGTLIANQATVTADEGINTPSDDNGTDSDGKNPTLTPVDDDNGSGVPGGLTKSLLVTSESDSLGANLMIGEVATFRVTVAIPAGTLRQATLSDTLPTGLSYVPGTARLARTFDIGLNAQLDPGGINRAASGDFVDLADDSDLELNGQTLSLALGDIINSDADANAERYTLEYHAVVANIADNQAGHTLTNSATLDYLDGLSQPRRLTPVEYTATVVEPAVQIEKRVAPGGVGQFGGEVTFTVTLTNPSNGGNVATAYDLRVLDTLPDTYSGWTLVSTTPSGGLTETDITNNSTATTLDIAVAALPPDARLTIVYQATAPAGLEVDAITNTARATWTSLPGARGTDEAAPDNAGTLKGERTGSGNDANDYAIQDDAVVTVGDVSFTKVIVDAQTRYAIGETVTFQLSVDLPPGGVLTTSQISDQLDSGLTYVAGSLNRAFDSDVSATGATTDFTRRDDTPSTGLETLSLELGTLTNASDAVAGLTLRYQARVDNQITNQNNHGLNNTATLAFDDPLGGDTHRLTDSQRLTVGEPVLTLAKTLTSATTNLDAGDTIDFQVVVGNSGTTTAYDVVLTDALPDGLEAVNDLRVTATSDGLDAPSLTNNGDDWYSESFDLPVGASVTLAFSATLSDSVIPEQTLQNRITATFSSLSGQSEHERDGSDEGSEQTDGNLDNYNASAVAPIVTVANPIALDKRFHPVVTKTTYTIGEPVNYRLRIELIEGTIQDLIVTDTLPEGVRFERASIGLGNVAMRTERAGDPSQNDQTLTFDLGDVLNPANGQHDDDVMTIDITVIVENVENNVADTVLGNHAALSYTGPQGTETLDYDADDAADNVQPLELTLVEPRLELTKRVSRAQVPPGKRATFTILIDHTAESGADAYDLVITDTLPAGLTYVPDSASHAVTVNGQTLSVQIAALTLASDQTSITFEVIVDRDATFGQALENSAQLDYSSRPGTNEDERAYQDSDKTQITPAETTYIAALKNVTLVDDTAPLDTANAGETLEYRVVLTNTGSVAATNVVFTDPIPANTAYVADSTTLNGSRLADSGGGLSFSEGVMTLQIGTLAAAGEASATATITFRVALDSDVPAGTMISNQGVVDSDQTVPTPTDGDANPTNGAQPTDLPVGGQPALTSALYAEKTVTWRTDADSSNTVTAGDTLRYTIVLRNRGASLLTGLDFSDTIPTGLRYTGTSDASSGSVTVDDQTVSWTGLADLAPGASHTLSFDVTITSVTGDSQTFNNQGTATATGLGDVPTDSNGDPSDGAQPTTITAIGTGSAAPALDLQKRWSLVVDGGTLGQVDPGDTLQYTLTVTNTGAQAATDVRLTDTPLPSQLTTVADSLITSLGVVETQDPIAVNLGTLNPGQIATVSFKMTVNADTAGQIASNQAKVTRRGDTDGVLSDDNGHPDDELNPTLTPIGTVAPSALSKTLITTSQDGDASAAVQIGEILTYQLQFAVPAGTTGEVTLTDSLPTGLRYVANSARLQRVFNTGLSASRNPGDINTTPSGTFTDLSDASEVAITPATDEQGPVLSVFLGTVINSDSNPATSEHYILDVQAQVDNVGANQAGTVLNNSAGLSYRDTAGRLSTLSPVTHTATVSEPALQLTKQADVNTLLASGGTLRYTLTLTNPSGPNVG